MTDTDQRCPGADDPEERCPRHPKECTCWQVDLNHPTVGANPMTIETELPAVKVKATNKQEDVHPDDLAVDRFSASMKAKLAKKRAEGFGGWDDPEQCHIDYLVSLLLQQIHERAVLDPVDIANLSMMIHERGETPEYGR